MRITGWLLVVFLSFVGICQAQEQKLRVGIFEKPPFAMKSKDGTWTGIAVSVWDKMAIQLSLPFEYVELTEEQAIEDTASGKLDLVLGEIAISPDRARRFHFSQPYIAFPAAVAFPHGMRFPHWASFLRDVFEHGVTSMLLVLIGAMVIFSILLWIVERRVDRTHFGGRPLHGFGSALWFAAVTMTTVGYGDKTPQSIAGRLIVFFWMFFGVVVISVFTGTVASSIALSRVALDVNSTSDLARFHNGVIAGSTLEEGLGALGIRTRGFSTVQDGLRALESGSINAFISGEATLRYVVQEEFAGRIVVAPIPDTHMSYAFGMRHGLAQRDAIDVALISLVSQPEWHTEIERFIGPSIAP
jgi:polar amino acid transport system substrate-binding protein